MITNDDIEKLVDANAEVRQLLQSNKPRDAAKRVCDRLDWLNSQGSFWSGLRSLSGKIAEHQAGVSKVLDNLTDFIDAECEIFKALKLDPAKTDPVIGAVYADIGVIQHLDLEDITDAGLSNLHQHVKNAAKLVCEHRKNAFLRGVDWVVGWKGARILSGAALAGANALALGTPLLVAHPLSHLESSVAAVSITVGTTLIKGDALGLLELLKPTGKG